MNKLARVATFLAVPATVFGLSQLHGARLAPDPYEFVRTGRVLWAVAYVLLLLGACYIVGLPGAVRSMVGGLVTAGVAVSMAAVGISIVQLALGDALLPRFVVFGSALVLAPVLASLGMAHRISSERSVPRDRVFFVGGETERVNLAEELGGQPERPASLVGWRLLAELQATPGVHDLAEEVEATGATLLVLDLHAQADTSIVAVAARLHESGMRIRTLSLFYEEWLGKLPVSELERVSLLFDVGELHRARYARVKRIVDVLVAVPGVVALGLVAPLIALLNIFGNRGPLLFRQQRVGKGGRTFTILKFRTMRPGTDDGSWTIEGDARITPVGSLLRRTHLDEIPQVLNILRGDLSLVGPRPEQPRYVEELTEKLPFYGVRHLVRPGLTGWAQVKYGYAGDEADALEKLQYEFFYLRRQGLALDARIIGRTSRTVFGRHGR